MNDDLRKYTIYGCDEDVAAFLSGERPNRSWWRRCIDAIREWLDR